MKINDLVRRFEEQNINNFLFGCMLNAVADYTMYEQAIVKKDNKSNAPSTIKYRYDKNSYEYVNEFFSKIEFLSVPRIGKGKEVLIRDLPDVYQFPTKHEIPIESKIYILDKIKDSFMHLNGEDTLYDFDYRERKIIIENEGIDYSLKCKIPIEALLKFNSKIRVEYDKTTPSLDWVNNYLLKSRQMKGLRTMMAHRIPGTNQYVEKVSYNRRVIFGNDNPVFLEKSFGGVKSITLRDIAKYHTDSYVTLLMASGEGKEYPMLSELYDFDFRCENSTYREMLDGITKRMDDFVFGLLPKIEYMNHDRVVKEVLDFLWKKNLQNGKEEGLIVDIDSINKMIIGKFLRNARSHANNKATDDETFGEENILYYDVLFNSLTNTASEKSEPTFLCRGKKKEFDKLFRTIRECNISNIDLHDIISNEVLLGKYDTLDLFLNEVDKFIIQAAVDGSVYAESLSLPLGNARDFNDFIKKVLEGTFVKDDSSKFITKI